MEKDLRLRLVVRRHAVPDVKLLWNATATEDLTISRLLAQINEVVPLESGDWGLEDYAVELKDASGEGFECVHYHLVSKVLKDDDQVLVRPLLTGDLKRRKLSGRHQISADGKHLVDGLAFGRPWLRAPRDRPAVTLPPRKKVRITYTSDDDHESSPDAETPMLEYDSTRAQQDPSSVRLRARFYDAESDDDDDDEDDDEFEPGADGDTDDDMDAEDDDMQEELRLLKEDNAIAREGDIMEELRNIQDKRTSSGTKRRHDSSTGQTTFRASASNALVKSVAAPQLDMDSLDKMGALREAYPDAPISVVEQTLLRCENDPKMAYFELLQRFNPYFSLDEMLNLQARSLSKSPIRPSESSAGLELVLRGDMDEEDEDDEDEDEDEDEEDEDDEDEDEEDEDLDDEDVFRDDEGMFGGYDDLEEAYADLNGLIGSRRSKASRQDVSSDSDSSSDSSADPNSDSSSDSSSNSDSDQEMGDRNEDPRDSSDSSDDSSNSSDDSSSDSEDDGSIRDHRSSKSVDHGRSSPVDPESDSSDSEASSLDPGEQQHATKAAAGSEDSSDSSADSSSDSSGSHDSPSDSSDSSSEDSSSDDSSSESEPEELPTRTLSNSHKNLQSFEPPQLPTTTPVSDAPSQTPPVAPGQGLSKTQRRNARRKLAKQMASQARSNQTSVSETPDEAAAFQARKRALLEAISDPAAESQSQEKSPENPDSAPRDSTTHEGNETSQSLGSPEESGSTQRRVKPNIGAARRMLMGSLGLKNPKSKADEDKIRQDLMKGVRPHTNARLTEPSPQPEESAHTQESVDEEPEAWREKISYRAVECCHDGIELSEPPFPFVQRWDPQQQIESWFGTKNKRGGKRKRAQQDQAQVPEDGDSQESKKRRLTGGGVTFSDAVESMEEGNTTLNYDDPVEEAPVANGQPLESQAIDFEDLPSLPSDLTSLPPLLPGKAIAGMVITWKQLVLSPATNWQPEVVNLTGVLVRVYDEDATDLEFLLAQRDRNLDRTEKVYDEITGKRVYDRFEAPDDDEEDESEADDGYRRLTFAELIEPKILQEPLGEKETPKGQEESSGPTDSVIHETVYDDQSQPSHANEEMTGQSEAGEGSQSQDVAEESQANANTDDGQSHNGIDSQRGVSERDQPSSNVESQPEHAAEQNAEDDVSTPKASTNPPKATEDDSQQSTSSLGQALSISSDRRHEISLMIAEAGFRKDVAPSILRARTNSPSRQLMEMSGAVDDSQPLSEMTAAKENTPIASKEQTAGTEDVPPPSSASSVRSGRQPDTDFSFDMGGDDMPHIGDTGGGSPVLGETTPRAEVQTPKRGKQASVEPSTRDSVDFPGLDQLFLTATSQQHTQDSESPSKSQVLSELQSRKVIVRRDEEYEAAMRRLDDEEDDEEDEEEEESQSPRPFRRTRKQLFPNSSQPMPSRSPELPDIKPVIKTAPSSFSEATDAWPSTRTRKRKSSPFVLPEGSQVISLSSRSSSPVEEYIELYAEDDIDEDYEEKSSSLPHGAGWVQMNKPPRAKSRAKSMPAARAGHKAAGGRRSIPPSTVPEMSKKSRGSRKSSVGL